MCSKVRPHHGLCIQFFEGKGYSDAFTRHMEQVIAHLNGNPRIELAGALDEICSCCPNCKADGCITNEKVRRYDDKVLELTGTQTGQKLYWKEFVHKVREDIMDAGKMKEVCSDCGWADICHK